MLFRILVSGMLIVLSHSLSGQLILNALVADSASQRPLPYVNIKIKNSQRHTLTSDEGFFLIDVRDTDTLSFSMVGFKTKTMTALELKDKNIIYLREEIQQLQEITFQGTFSPFGLPKIPPKSPYRNTTSDSNFTSTPGFQGVQTFGPGVVISGPFSRFSKDVREKKKHLRVYKENQQSKGYAELVNHDDVKGRIIRTYHLTEEQYYRDLALFNEKNRDIIYELDPNELISLLFAFFEKKHQQK